MKTFFIYLFCVMMLKAGAGQFHEGDFIITNVHVIDVETGEVIKSQDVVIAGDKITSIVEHRVGRSFHGEVIDGNGKYLIPGLWDMHVHSWDDDLTRSVVLPLYVAYGVTGVRELSGSPGQLRLRVETAKGELLGPRMVVGSPLVDGPNPFPVEVSKVRVGNAEEATEMVDSLKAQGYDFIKTYKFLSSEACRALYKRSREIGMEVSGEIPISISLWEAVAMGHRTVEHLIGVELACSAQEEELRVKYRQQVREISADTTLRTHIPVWNRTEWEPLATWDAEKCRALFRHLAAHGTWVVPTLAIQQHISYASDPVIRNDPRQRHLPPGWWDPEGVAEWLDPDRHLRPTYEHRLRSIPDLYRAGIGILAGTDMLGGFPLHNELALFVDAGLTPLEALRTATLNPARYLKATDSLGTVEVGKLADLVLLDANPLEDITNTQKIQAVMANGRYFDRKELDELLEQVERAAKD